MVIRSFLGLGVTTLVLVSSTAIAHAQQASPGTSPQAGGAGGAAGAQRGGPPPVPAPGTPREAAPTQATSPQSAAPNVPPSGNGPPGTDAKPTAPAAPSRPMAGYSFGNGTSSLGQRRTTWHAPSRVGPVASFPAFAEGDQGVSHLTVQLSAAVPFEQQAGPGFVVYRLKGARVLRSNDTNPLVAVHFNTPLVTAKLRNVGKDVELRIELRAQVQPTAHVDALAPAQASATTTDAPVTPAAPAAPPSKKGHHRPAARVAKAQNHGPVATSQFVVDFPAGNYLDTPQDLK